MLFGASALERFWPSEYRRVSLSFINRAGFTCLNDLALDQIVQRCAALPRPTRLAIDAGRIEQGADEVIRDEARLLTAIGKPTVK